MDKPHWVHFARKEMGLSRERLSLILQTSTRNLYNWEYERVGIPEKQAIRLKALHAMMVENRNMLTWENEEISADLREYLKKPSNATKREPTLQDKALARREAIANADRIMWLRRRIKECGNIPEHASDKQKWENELEKLEGHTPPATTPAPRPIFDARKEIDPETLAEMEKDLPDFLKNPRPT